MSKYRIAVEICCIDQYYALVTVQYGALQFFIVYFHLSLGFSCNIHYCMQTIGYLIISTDLMQGNKFMHVVRDLPTCDEQSTWVAISNLCDSTFCSIKILMQKLLMKMSLLVDHKKAQSLPFQTKFVSCKSGK